MRTAYAQPIGFVKDIIIPEHCVIARGRDRLTLAAPIGVYVELYWNDDRIDWDTDFNDHPGWLSHVEQW